MSVPAGTQYEHALAQPLANPGAMKSLERVFGSHLSDLRAPKTRTLRLIFNQSAALPWLPCKPGIFQWDGTSIRSASGKRAKISCARGKDSMSGS